MNSSMKSLLLSLFRVAEFRPMISKKSPLETLGHEMKLVSIKLWQLNQIRNNWNGQTKETDEKGLYYLFKLREQYWNYFRLKSL